MRTRTLDDDSKASVIADIELSRERLARLEPRVRGWRGKLFDLRLSLGHGEWLGAREVFAEQLRYGDAGPALVGSLEPLRVYAYANELDAVVPLRFPDELAQWYDLEEGSRLLGVCTYAPAGPGRTRAPDLLPGPRASGHFVDAAPLIAEFLSEEASKLELYRRFQVPEDQWQRVAGMVAQHRDCFGDRARDGRPVSVCFDVE